MENFKGQVPFQCSLVYFSSDFFFLFFPLFSSEGAGQRSHWKHWDRENHPELGELSGWRRKGRILNKREELAICQKLAYSLCLSAEQWAGFGDSAKAFMLPHWAHKVFGLEAAVPINSERCDHLSGRDRAGTEGWDIWLPPSATTAMSSRALGKPQQNPYWSWLVLISFFKGRASSTRTFSPTTQQRSHSGVGRAKGHSFPLSSYEDCKGTNSQCTLIPHRDVVHNQCHRDSCGTCLALTGDLFWGKPAAWIYKSRYCSNNAPYPETITVTLPSFHLVLYSGCFSCLQSGYNAWFPLLFAVQLIYIAALR